MRTNIKTIGDGQRRILLRFLGPSGLGKKMPGFYALEGKVRIILKVRYSTSAKVAKQNKNASISSIN